MYQMQHGLPPRFRFARREFGKGHEELCLLWRQPNGSELVIRSPLAKYLRFSRRPAGPTQWHPLYGYTLARDYAVFARLRISPGNPRHSGESYFHYFIGGIRGLGTWGAGWFIDHRSTALADLVKENRPDDDIELLLEVTYQDYKIKDAVVVSEMPKEYFKTRHSDAFIKSEVMTAQTMLSFSGRNHQVRGRRTRR